MINDIDPIKTCCELPSIDDSQGWITWHRDPRLARYLKGLEGKSLEQIAYILVQRVRSTPTDKVASNCLTAFLSYLFFSARGQAKIRATILNPLQYHAAQIDVGDIYQIGLIIISQPVQFLENFESADAGWYCNLLKYSNSRFDRVLIDRVRSLPGMSGFKRTNLGLLARSSPRRVKLALIDAGERDPRLAQMILIHHCLVEVIATEEFDTKAPQSLHYDNLLARYREECSQDDLAIDDRATLIKLLEYMGKVVRNYLQPQPDSLDRSIGTNDADGISLIDLIPDLTTSSPSLESQILKQSVTDLLGKLSIEDDRLLMFFYGLDMTQTEVGIEFDRTRFFARNHHNSCLTDLAKKLYAQDYPGKKLSSEDLNSIINDLKIVCEDIYVELLEAIVKIVKVLSTDLATTIALFIDRVEQRWQFKFQPNQNGLIKGIDFVKSRLSQ
jgi:hypothetical protein